MECLFIWLSVIYIFSLAHHQFIFLADSWSFSFVVLEALFVLEILSLGNLN